MAQTRFTCTLTTSDEPACQSYARVTIAETEGASARACPRHAIAALDGITCAHVDWADSKGLNEWSAKPLSCPKNETGSDRSVPVACPIRWHRSHGGLLQSSTSVIVRFPARRLCRRWPR
jgi:hypothetical protein